MAKPPVELKGFREKVATERLIEQFLGRIGISRSEIVDFDEALRRSAVSIRSQVSNLFVLRRSGQTKNIPN